MTNETRDTAVERLEAALVEEDRLGDVYRAAMGTSSEFAAHVRLHAANDDVTAREAWLKSIDGEVAGGRVWINGREVGGTESLYLDLEESHD